MSERPTPPPPSSAMEPAGRRPHDGSSDARSPDERGPAVPSRAPAGAQRGVGATRAQSGGQSLATRAARFRNGAPFLVERATLYDPYPLDPLPVVEVTTLPRVRSQPLLPIALTLLGVVIVVGLAAGVLFVRNVDAPRNGEHAGRAAPSGGQGDPRRDPAAAPQGGVAYDLTRRPTDAITGAWRLSRELGNQDEGVPAPPAAIPSAPAAARRSLPRRLVLPRAEPTKEQLAEQAPSARPPLDEPHVPKALTEGPPGAGAEDRPPKAVADGPPDSGHLSHMLQAADAQPANQRPAANVVARVRREAEAPEAEQPRRRSRMPVRLKEDPDAEPASKSGKGGGLSRRALRAQQRKMRKAQREARDLDRFLLRDKGDIEKGFVFSGPQGQRP